MGFSLNFMAIDGDDVIDADRERLRSFLDERGLTCEPDQEGDIGTLLDHAGRPLALDGSVTDLHITPLDHEGEVTGGIWHATLGPEELEFIFDLCIAAGWLVINPQESPNVVVPRRNHSPERLTNEWFDPTAWVDDASELGEALSGSHEGFLNFKRRALG